jgi:L,D-transpeptidase YcbB
MPGVRIDRFVASTAIILLLSATVGSALAEPKSGLDTDAMPGSATPAAPPPPKATEPDQTSVKPANSAAETTAPAAQANGPAQQPSTAAVAPSASSTIADPTTTATVAPAVLVPETPLNPDPSAAATLAQTVAPTSPPDADQSSTQPAPPAATQTPSATQTPAAAQAPTAPQPTAATGGDEVPTPTVSAPPAPTPTESAATSTPSPGARADAAITEQLRELANGKFDRIVGGKKERPAIEAFYSARNYAPLWITDGKANPRAKGAIAYLGQVDADGLDPADYPVPNFVSLIDPAALADAEIRLTESVITYAHHAQVGRVHWTRVSGDIFYEQKPSTPAEVLAAIAQGADAAATLAAYEPQHPAYVALKAKLAEIRAGKQETGKTPIPNGPALKAGMQDERVPQLRQRLGVRGEATTYDKDLAEAVKKFQQEHELKPTGLLTPQTVDALNGRQPDRAADTIIANLERWRWMAHDLGKTYVIVNLPEFALRVVHNGKVLWMTRIVEGKPAMPTPIMSAEMKYITVNPTWNVPPSIIAREYLPALQQDPSVLERMGLKVSTNPDGTVHIAQPPGERNALGRLRFNFPNKFLVYQHDTPEKQLFAYEKRAFSHGCMRVQDPVRYAEVLLSIARPNDGYTQDRIRKMFGNSEFDIQFPKVIPVHLTYQTAFVDENGKLEFREDVYGRDKELLTILRGDERKVADTPIERRENVIRREALAMPDQGFFGGRNYYPSGSNFFTHLFGAPVAAPPAPPPAPAARKRAAQRPTEIR